MISEDQKTKIVELWEEGLSGTQIGELLSLTRNAVIGVVNRLRKKGFKFKRNEKVEHKKRVSLAREKREEDYQKRNAKKLKKPLVIEVEKQEKIYPIPILPTRDGGIDLIDLKRTSCRFIVSGDDTPIKYCGETQDRGAYCRDHYKICYYPAKIPAEKLIKI